VRQMERLWAPWRAEYIASVEEMKDCLFCTVGSTPAEEDAKNFLLLRAEKCFVMLNAFPYNTGHVMVAPFRHVGNLEEMDDAELAELMKLTQFMERVLKKAYKPHGFNIGMNLGAVAGAGVRGHIHLHILPRWEGDTNFMPTIGQTKVLSESLEVSYEKIKGAINELGGERLG